MPDDCPAVAGNASGGVRLLVNVITSAAGHIAVGVEPADGKPPPTAGPFELQHANRIKGNAIAAVASWSAADDRMASLDAWKGRSVRLHVEMVDARLFSLRMACGGETKPIKTDDLGIGPAFDESTGFRAAPIDWYTGAADTAPGPRIQPPASRSLAARFSDILNVKDYGARGDGTGSTPADEGVSIAAERWNNWTLYPFYGNQAWSPFWHSGKFEPPRPQPFSDTDTWDSIGINLALWNANGVGASVHVPAGIYSINVAEAPIMFMKGQESSIRGDGMYHTVIGPSTVAMLSRFVARSVSLALTLKASPLQRRTGRSLAGRSTSAR